MFNYQGSSFSLSSDSSFIISHCFSLVKNFFHFFEVFSNFILFAFLLRVSLHILPCCFLFVKSVFSFFYIFFFHFRLTSQPPYLSSRKIPFLLRCKQGKRRRRDLNPRAAINDLLPFQGSPFGQLGYFSKMSAN